MSRRTRYHLNASFQAGDQGYSDSQVLRHSGDGMSRWPRQSGSLTIVEKDGTLALVDNALEFAAQATPVWGDLGVYDPVGVERVLGLGCFWALIFTTRGALWGWKEAPGVALGTRWHGLNFTNPLRLGQWTGSGYTSIETTVATGTKYQLVQILGGYDVGGVPWRLGESPDAYRYGAATIIKGGVHTTWALLWREKARNTSPLYTAFSNYNAAGTLCDFRIPSADLSAVLQPQALSLFDAPNGTSLEAITPEVGGAWTGPTWDIQGGKARNQPTGPGTELASIQSGVPDAIFDVEVAVNPNNTRSGLVVNLDNAASPANFVIAYHDGIHVQLEKCVAGTYTQMITRTVAFVANAVLRIIKAGTDYSLFYNGAKVGATVTIADAGVIDNTRAGLLSTHSDNRLDSFAVYPRTSRVYERILGNV